MNRHISVLVLLFSAFFLFAQESCYEQYFREHNKEIFPAIDENDDSYDELKKMALARQLMHNEAFIAERAYPSRPNTQTEALFQPILLAIDTVDTQKGVLYLLNHNEELILHQDEKFKVK